MKNRKKGIAIALDISSAFDSPFRSTIYKTMIEKWGNDLFIHNFRLILEKLELNVDLGFTFIKGIPSRRGAPQGILNSC